MVRCVCEVSTYIRRRECRQTSVSFRFLKLKAKARGAVDRIIEELTLVNAGIQWRDADDIWSLQLQVSNLLDKFYFMSKSYPDAPSFLGVGVVAPPREWAVTVKRTF